MTHASLFSGVGGFDLAAEWAGFKNIFNCEIDSFCRKVLKYHFPNSKHYENIKSVDFRPYRGRINVLTGGFPCQPFSVAGNRKGVNDDRYLWSEFLRAIREIRPSWVIGENVAGILSMVEPHSKSIMEGDETKSVQTGRRYVADRICEDLEAEGYNVQPVVIPACAVGAPHRRDRVWFIAYSGGIGWEGWVDNREERRDQTYEFWNFQEDKSERCDFFGRFGIVSSPATDTYGAGFQAQGSKQQTTRFEQHGKLGKINTDTDGHRWQKCEFTKGSVETRQCVGSYYSDIPNWREFPTQPPVCSGDDGIPDGLDGITLPKWRTESIKAYGNAIVPQVAFEILTLIKQISYDRD